MLRKERKRKRGIETVENTIVWKSMLSLRNYYTTGFRLDHRWNRTTMGDNAVTVLVTITVASAYNIQIIAMAYVNFYCVSGKTGD